MSIGVIGRKVGMTRIFFENGESVPVTVVEVKDNRVAHHKTVEKMVTVPFRWRLAKKRTNA